MSQSREIAVGNGEILELRIEGEKRYRPQTNEDTEKRLYLCRRGEKHPAPASGSFTQIQMQSCGPLTLYFSFIVVGFFFFLIIIII